MSTHSRYVSLGKLEAGEAIAAAMRTRREAVVQAVSGPSLAAKAGADPYCASGQMPANTLTFMSSSSRCTLTGDRVVEIASPK